MSVFGVRKEFLDVYTPKTSISASAGAISVKSSLYITNKKIKLPLPDHSIRWSQIFFASVPTARGEP